MIDESRRARLHAIKLAALVRDHLGLAETPIVSPDSFGAGAALLHDEALWVLVAEVTSVGDGLGAALAAACRAGSTALHVIVDEGDGHLARRAGGFRMPIMVWRADGRSLVAAAPLPLPEVPAPTPTHLEFVDLIVGSGADLFVEHGVVVGEVLGLEVCRVVDDPATGAVRLEVGVGAHDREAFQLLHGDRPTESALAEVVETVRRHRTDPSDGHPLARLGRERLLRAALQRTPGLIDLTSLAPIQPPLPRANLKQPVPCVAEGRTDRGDTVTVVCSTGIDLEAVPYAVDANEAHGAARSLLVMPRRDAIPLQRQIAALAEPPVDVVGVDLDAVLATLANA